LRRPGKASGFGQVAEKIEGFSLHNDTGIHEIQFFVNLMMLAEQCRMELRIARIERMARISNRSKQR
jgi:hypothetical protein